MAELTVYEGPWWCPGCSSAHASTLSTSHGEPACPSCGMQLEPAGTGDDDPGHDAGHELTAAERGSLAFAVQMLVQTLMENDMDALRIAQKQLDAVFGRPSG